VAEKNSEHPIADAILKKAEEVGLKIDEPKGFEALPGLGVKAFIDNIEILVGNHTLLVKEGLSFEGYKEAAEQLSKQGKTIIYVAASRKVIGLVAVADTLKEGAKEAVKELKTLGMTVLMLTGDY